MKVRNVKIMLAVGSVIFTLPAIAQHDSPDGRFGVMGGLNLSRLTAAFDSGLDKVSRPGGGFGGLIEGLLAPGVAIRIEGLYLQKGARVRGYIFDDYINDVVDFEGTLMLDYVEASAMMKLALGSPRNHAYLIAGPAAGYNVKSESKVVGFVRGTKLIEDVSELDNPFTGESAIREYDFGINVGFGINIQHFFIEGRYAYGLAKINKFGDVDLQHRGLQLMAGITAPLQ